MSESIFDGKIDHESILHPFHTPLFWRNISLKRGARAILLAISEKSTRVDFRVKHDCTSQMIDYKIDSYVQLYDTMH